MGSTAAGKSAVLKRKRIHRYTYNMNITELLNNNSRTAFSFEVLPPLKGKGLDTINRTIETLREFDPKYINITTHHSEVYFREAGNGLYQAERLRRRPGTVAVAAALQHKYGIPVVPHILCSGFTKEETEYVLIDLQFLGITNLLLLRGDKGKDDKRFRPTEGGHEHTTELEQQVNDYNDGRFLNGEAIEFIGEKFSYGVACYPEKHEEALNLRSDLQRFRQKVKLGAGYGVTQMFFDNSKYFAFVDAARSEGISVPIIPGIKPFTKLSQLTAIPRTFRCDFPEEFVSEAAKCRTDDDARQFGVEWGITQCRELVRRGVPSIHFYTMGAAESIRRIAKEIY